MSAPLRSPIGAGTAELWLAACRDTQRQPGHWEGEKGREKLLRGSLVQVLWYVAQQADGSESSSIGAVAAPSTRPAPPQACPLAHKNSVTTADNSLGATVGAGVRTKGGLCCPPLQQGAYYDTSCKARTRPPPTSVPQPRLSDRRHICPYGRYRRPGPGEGTRGAGRSAARAQGRKGGESPDNEGETGTQKGGRADRQREVGG